MQLPKHKQSHNIRDFLEFNKKKCLLLSNFRLQTTQGDMLRELLLRTTEITVKT